MTKYKQITLDGLDEVQESVVSAVINEGKLRMRDEVLEKIERKITENYHNKDLVSFLEELIRDLNLDL